MNKKALLLGSGLVLGMCTNAVALSAAASEPSSSGFYVEGSLGYAYTPWKSILGSKVEIPMGPGGAPGVAAFSYPQNANGGFTWGGDVGYALNSWLGVELGAWKLPTTKIRFTYAPMVNQLYKYSTYAVYLAGKLSHRMSDSFELYSKFGLSYQHLNVTVLEGDTLTRSAPVSTSHIGPFFAAGLSYYFIQNLSFSAQISRIAGKSDHGSDQYLTHPLLYTMSIGWHF